MRDAQLARARVWHVHCEINVAVLVKFRSASTRDRLTGPLITAITVLGMNALTDGDFVARPLYLACVVYSVFRGGVGAGLVSTALVVADAVIRLVAIPFGLDESLRQLNFVALACLVLVLVTGHLKRRADSASELSQANSRLTGQLRERARTEEAAITLAAVTRELVEPPELTDVHHRIVSTILDLFGIRRAMLYSLDAAAQELVCVAAAGDVDDTRWLGDRMPACAGVVGRAIREHRVVCVTDPRGQDDDDPLTARLPADTGTSAQTLALPLHARGKVLGALTLGLTDERAIGATDLQLLAIFAGHAALALENSRLHDDLRGTLQKLGESQGRLVDDARLRASEEVAAGVAHHVNNRLTVILAAIQLLMPKTVDRPDDRRSLEIMERTTLDTARLIERLRQFTLGRPRGGPESADLNLAVQRAVGLCRADHAEAESRGVQVDVVLELATIPRVVADEAMLEEALGHILRNAIEAVADRGTVTITTWVSEGSVLCTVADTGVGMPPDVVQRAAEPFFTTKGPQRPGLGLSCALGLMRQLGGHLEVRSDVNAGTRVTVRLRAYVA
jgi:signal transduction histidine kinase